MPELKDLQNTLMGAFEELKKVGERQTTELKQFGQVTQDTKTMVDRINTEMDEAKKRIDELETKANRSPLSGGGGKPADPQLEAKRAAFFKYMREGKGGLGPEERKALVEDSTGQILVPEDIDSDIIREVPKISIVRPIATVRTTGRDRVRKRSMSEVTIGWGKLETSGGSKKLSDFESTPTPDDDFIYVEDAYGLVKIGEDELEDSDVNLQEFLASSFSQAYAESEDKMFIVGRGHTQNEPEGMLNGTVVTRLNSAAVGAVDDEDFIKLAYEVPAQYRRNGSYITNSKTELAMRLIKDSDGQYLWQPSLQAGVPASFAGYLVYAQDDVPVIASAADVAIFGDIRSAYRIIDRKGGTMTRLNELYIEDGLIGFKYKRRTSGGIIRPNALRVLKVRSS